MTKNLIPEVAHMLGVEVGEEFKIKEYGERIYRFANSGLQLIYDNGVRNLSITTNMALSGLLSGDIEIVKLQRKPKHFERYWTFTQLGKNEQWSVTTRPWLGTPEDISMLKAGWVYHSYKEAQAALPAVTAEYGIELEL